MCKEKMLDTHTHKLYMYMTDRTDQTVALLDSCMIFAQQRELGRFYRFISNPVTQSSSEQIQRGRVNHSQKLSQSDVMSIRTDLADASFDLRIDLNAK